MSDDLRDWNGPPLLGDIVAVLDVQLEQGRQFYAMQVAEKWLVFYNGPALRH